MKIDLIIRDGRILDGTGAPEKRGDVAVAAGKIHAISERLDDLEASDVIDASGLVVAPGFVDIHSHGDLVLAWPSEDRLSLLEGRLAQGITTEVVGNCGLGACPLFGYGKELLPDINGWMSPARFDWTWTDVNTYFAHLERVGIPLNVGTLVPHGPLRLGAAHLASGETDATARQRMIDALDAALDDGALGLSAGLIYPPGMYTSTEELTFLARRLGRSGGVLTAHVRGSSETLLDAVGELIQIGRTAGVPVHHSHTEAVGRAHWWKLVRVLELEDEARAEGLAVSADMFPYPVAATMMLAIYPPWSLQGGLPRLLERLADRPIRERIRRDIESVVPEWPPWRDNGWPHNLVKAVGWNRICVSSVGTDGNKEVEGLSLEQLGRRRNLHPFDAISDLMIEEEGNVGQFVLDVSGEEGLRRLIARPDVAFITDANDYGKGKPHPAAYGSFARVLARYVRQESILSLPEAIRRMTSLPAEILGLQDRGRLEAGAYADVVLFDSETISDRATLEAPREKALGVDTVLVNGRPVYRKNALTGALPGRTLRRERAAR